MLSLAFYALLLTQPTHISLPIPTIRDQSLCSEDNKFRYERVFAQYLLLPLFDLPKIYSNVDEANKWQSVNSKQIHVAQMTHRPLNQSNPPEVSARTVAATSSGVSMKISSGRPAFYAKVQ